MDALWMFMSLMSFTDSMGLISGALDLAMVMYSGMLICLGIGGAEQVGHGSKVLLP